MGSSQSSQSTPLDDLLGPRYAPDIDLFLYRAHVQAHKHIEAKKILKFMKMKYRQFPVIMELLNDEALRNMDPQTGVAIYDGRYKMMY